MQIIRTCFLVSVNCIQYHIATVKSFTNQKQKVIKFKCRELENLKLFFYYHDGFSNRHVDTVKPVLSGHPKRPKVGF